MFFCGSNGNCSNYEENCIVNVKLKTKQADRDQWYPEYLNTLIIIGHVDKRLNLIKYYRTKYKKLPIKLTFI